MPAALVPLKLARVLTGRLLASSVVKSPLMVGESVSIALTLSPVDLHLLLHGADCQLRVQAQFLPHFKRHPGAAHFSKLGAATCTE
jgi:hypothetical protein